MGYHSYSFKATIHIEDMKDPNAVYRALLPESYTSKRFRAEIEKDRDHVVIKIDSKDPTSLRAALNSYLRLIALLNDVEEVL